MTVSEALAIAFQHYRAGRLKDADQVCQQILAAEPSHAETLHLAGVIAHQSGESQRAVELICRAIESNPLDANFHSNLGDAFKVQGKPHEAIACCHRALELNPHLASAHNNLAAALMQLGKLDEAVTSYRRAIELDPSFATSHNNLGHVLQTQGKLDEAEACFRQTLALDPSNAYAHNNLGAACFQRHAVREAIDSYRAALALKPAWPEALNNLGVALQAQGQSDEALACFERALELAPHYAESHYSMGNALHAQGKPDQAVACYRRAIEQKPDYAEAHNNLGAAFQGLGQIPEAMSLYRQALGLKPQLAEAHNNLAGAFKAQLRLDEAEEEYGRALDVEPDNADAHGQRSLLWLLRGDFQRGWREYEWRWKTRQLPGRTFSEPQWDGGPLESRTLLLHSEQGFGDTFQFVRYAGLIKHQNPEATVIVQCPRALVRIMSSYRGLDRLIAEGDSLPSFDTHSPLLSLPGVLQTTIESIPASVPYLFAEPRLMEEWRQRLAQVGGYRIGINWRGRAGFGDFRKRDIPLDLFAALAQMPGVRLVSLQKGERESKVQGPMSKVEDDARTAIVDLGEFDTVHGAFMDTAAIMMNLDLVITSDTSVAHLAGALGVSVWVALPYVPDWRWLLDRSDSPWYPTMRLFRQKRIGDWAGVFAEIETALRERVQGSKFKVQG